MTKHQSSNNNQVPNSNDGTLFGDSVIGVYLELACLPVGRGFGYWNFKELTSKRE